MRADDKKIKNAFKELKVPVLYEERVDNLLKSMADREKEKEEAERRQQECEKGGNGKQAKRRRTYVLRMALCLLCICIVFSVATFYSDAGFFKEFRRSLMDFFGLSTAQEKEEAGLDSRPLYVEGKKDLIVEMQEAVMDSHTLYVLVKLVAPKDVVFDENVTFEYFGFCTGKNYDDNYLLGGSRNCELLEVSGERSNEALYVVGLSFDQEIADGTYVTCFLQNLSSEPYSEEPQLLVEGIWSLTFLYERTVSECVTVDGGEDMAFPLLDGMAVVERIELTPTTMMLLLDVSTLSYELMNVSDTTVAVRLLYLDGSEKIIVSHNPQENFIQGGSIGVNVEGERVTQRKVFEFAEVLNISQVAGVYVEDLFLQVQ